MPGILEDQVAIVTGAGAGLGREHALALAREGASVVVNDLGAAHDGTGGSAGPAEQVAAEIVAAGGRAVANTDNVAEWEGARRLVGRAIEAFGRLDALVNNAGILRDRMMVNMEEDEWDTVVKVHLKGTFAPARHAAAYWRDRAKSGETVDARIVNTTSSSGIFGNVGQSNYGAAKAGIAAFTVITAKELGRYGIRVNAVAPTARTRMTEDIATIAGTEAATTGWDPFDPANVSPMVAWLSSPASAGLTGRVFSVHGGTVRVDEGWVGGPSVDAGRRWAPTRASPT